jgi:two-component system sensor histidine kinase YesM
MLFFGIAFSLVSGISLCYDRYTEDYVDDIYRNQAKVDDYMNRVIFNLTYNHVVMFSDDNIASLENNPTHETFLSLYKTVLLGEEFLEMYALIDDLFYTSLDSNITEDINSLRMMLQDTKEGQYLSYFQDATKSYFIKPIFANYSSSYIGYAFYRFVPQSIMSVLKQINQDYLVMLITEKQVVIADDFDQTVFSFPIFETQNITLITEFKQVWSYIIKSTLIRTEAAFDISWNVLTVIPYYEVLKEISTLSVVLIIIAIISLGFTLFFIGLIIRSYMKPINTLSNKLRRYATKEKKEDEPALVTGKNEIVQLEASYDQMISRIHKLHEQSLIDVEAKRKLELNSLQVQINPHFLYNVLDAISWMAKIDKNERIDKLVIELSKFYRISLHKGDNVILVEEELEIVEHFLEIEKIRYPDLFDYEIIIDPPLGGYKMLKLLVQPLVENAVKHGLAPKRTGGRLIIRASLVNSDEFEIEVQDNGVGFDAKLLQTTGLSGYGLKNVNERIQLEYGPNYGLYVTSESGKGTKAMIKLPITK